MFDSESIYNCKVWKVQQKIILIWSHFQALLKIDVFLDSFSATLFKMRSTILEWQRIDPSITHLQIKVKTMTLMGSKTGAGDSTAAIEVHSQITFLFFPSTSEGKEPGRFFLLR
jgi:hypothetical protein